MLHCLRIQGSTRLLTAHSSCPYRSDTEDDLPKTLSIQRGRVDRRKTFRNAAFAPQVGAVGTPGPELRDLFPATVRCFSWFLFLNSQEVLSFLPSALAHEETGIGQASKDAKPCLLIVGCLWR